MKQLLYVTVPEIRTSSAPLGWCLHCWLANTGDLSKVNSATQ